MRSPLVIAHRGSSGHRPEHGEAAYRLAVAAGADAVEPDIVATRDGVLVLRHENEISGTTDVAERSEFLSLRTTKEVDGAVQTGWFTEDFTWAELQTLRIRERLPELRAASAAHDGEGSILRLVDLLHLLDEDAARDAGVRLVAEVKHATHFDAIGLPLGELVARELADAGWTDDPRLTFESFERAVLDDLRARGAGGRSVYLLDAEGAAADLVARDGDSATTYAEQLTPAGLDALVAAGPLDGISVPKAMLLGAGGAADPTLVESAHARGLDIYTWTLRPENAFLDSAHRSDVASAHRAAASEAEWGDWRSEFAAIAATGVDGPFADFPELARAVVDEAAAGVEASDAGAAVD